MHDDVPVGIAAEADWARYIAKLHSAGNFQGRSARGMAFARANPEGHRTSPAI
jgi:hypothetical protein